LQAHMTFLFTQIMPATSQSTCEAQPKVLKAHQHGFCRKSRTMQLYAWEIKRLKAKVRTLYVRKRSAGAKLRHADTESDGRHLISRTSKAFGDKKTSSHHKQDVLETFPSDNAAVKECDTRNFCHASHSKASAHPGDLSFKTTWHDDDAEAASPIRSTAKADVWTLEKEDLQCEPSVDMSSTSSKIDSETFMRRGWTNPLQAVLEETGSLPSLNCMPRHVASELQGNRPNLESNRITEMQLKKEDSLGLRSLMQRFCCQSGLGKETTNALSDFGDIPRERTQSREANFAVLSESARWSGMRPGRVKCHSWEISRSAL